MDVVTLETPVQFIKGIGPRIAAMLGEKQIVTVEDLLYHLPFRYEDRLHPQEIAELEPGETAGVVGQVRSFALLRTRRAPIFEMTVTQGMGTVKCMWFHGGYLKDRFRSGQMVALYGKVEGVRGSRQFQMIQPQFEVLEDDRGREATEMLEVGRIVPVYESLGGSRLSSRWQRRVLFTVLEELKGRIPETLPRRMLERLQFPGREESLRQAHFPGEGTPLADLGHSATAAQRRLIFEELFYLELGLELKRRKLREREGVAFTADERVRGCLREVLPFHPTGAQKRVLGEIVSDMRRPQVMRRLLQGDVGSGKTIVALEAMLIAIENGYQAALMAPTEILASQHYLAARKLLERSATHYNIVLLTGSLDEDRKRANRGKILRGEAQLVIGTHALIEQKVEFHNLGLVVVDEQHRFGVLQRFRLMKKPNAAEPDVLVMTATPIPRTLALSLYGDLDLSVIDELPPGRSPITTRRVPDTRSAEVWKFVRSQVKAGRQAYVVYPVIEGEKEDEPELDFASDPDPEAEPAEMKPAGKKKRGKGPGSLFPRPPLKAAAEMIEELRGGALAGLRLALLHGRMDADEKDVTMRRFQRGEIDVLVATTVVEVGVDVRNATVMVIEQAERFGLAQLHQLRGRVGRGAAKSYCILMTSGRVSPQAEDRLAAMLRTQDGFELAELDLTQRGPGEFFGTRQTGMPSFHLANLVRDRALLELARKEAVAFAAGPDPEITDAEQKLVWARLRDAWQRRYGLVEAG